jgi:tol-pal system protein YbgF
MFYSGLAIILIAPFLGSCATDEKFAYTNDQINTTNKKIASLEESIDKNIDQKLTNIKTNQAAIRLEINKLKEDISKLSGRVEENENLVKHSVEKDLTAQDALRNDLSGVSSRVAKLETSISQQQKYLNMETPEQDASVQEKPVAQAVTGVQAGNAEDTGEKYLYDTSLTQYNDGQYNDSMTGFKKFIDQFPKSDLAGNAQFWIGQCLMAQKDYEKAVLAFEDVIKKYPKNNKVANAMLAEAIAWMEMNDKTSSTFLLKKVIKQYPKTNEAKIAQKKLDTMK